MYMIPPPPLPLTPPFSHQKKPQSSLLGKLKQINDTDHWAHNANH